MTQDKKPTVKVTALEELPEHYQPQTDVTRNAPLPAHDGLAFRWVRAGGRHDNRSYWHGEGLRPVKKGAGIIRNEEAFDETADHTVRLGDLELWVETKGHAAERAAHKKQLADNQINVLQALLNDTSRAADEAGVELVPYAHGGGEGGVGRTRSNLGDLLLETPPDPADVMESLPEH